MDDISNCSAEAFDSQINIDRIFLFVSFVQDGFRSMKRARTNVKWATWMRESER